jgi:hypothetical protein
LCSLERCIEQSDEYKEAELMKSVWDLLFDRLSKVTFIVSATEETVSASKARKMQTIAGARGKMADKVWRTASGIEVAWQETAKQSEFLDIRKHSTDMLKVLKGTKDIIDFAIQKTGTLMEMFAVVASGSYSSSHAIGLI